MELTNSIANIRFIPKKLNKEILDKSPSGYLGGYSSKNPNIREALRRTY
jgi:hypothetical protein